jgi:DNA-binding transcriptional LysR family regulator
MGKAADVLGVTRVAVMQNIKTLGDQLGIVLFTATHLGITPTEDAEKLYPQIKEAMRLITETEKTVEPSGAVSRIKIAINNLYADISIKEYLKEFCPANPKVKMEFFTRDGKELLAQGKIDFMIDLDSQFIGTKQKTRELFTLSCIFVASKEFLAKRNLPQTITKTELVKLPFVSRRESWEIYRDAIGEIQLNVNLTASNDFTVSMARNGLGIGCLSTETLALVPTDLVIIKCPQVTLPCVKIVAAFNALQPSAKKFLDGYMSFLKRIKVS